MTLSSTSRLLLVLSLALGMLLPALPAGAQTATEDDLAYEVLVEGANEPLQVEVAPDGRIIYSERDGSIWVVTPEGLRILAGEMRPAGNLCEACTPEPDYLSHTPNRLGVGGLEEGGLHGLLLDNDFEENGKIYLYRSIAGTRHEVMPGVFWGEFHLSSFTMDPLTNIIDPTSEELLLTVPAEWDHCCHYGGDLDYLPDGTITLTVGDDVDASSSGGYGPRDVSNPWLNGELTAANPADRRGKVLRLNEDGSVPDGSQEGVVANPFIGMEGYNPYLEDNNANPYVHDKAGTPDDGWIDFDPYVYAMGFKQPWRAVVHPETGTMYVSDVGPDAGADDPERGPRGFEEINKIPFGGGTHYGWPRCMGPNWSYKDVNWQTMEVGDDLDCSATAPVARPIGDTDPTHEITGMTGATMYYPSGTSDEWPVVGSGGKTSEPSLFYPASTEGDLRLPERYNDRMIMLEWSRNFMLSIGYDPATGELNLDNDDMWKMAPPLYSVTPDADNPAGTVSVQQTRLMAPADAAVGPDGAVYFVEYGAFYYAGENGRLSRIRCASCAPADPSRNYGLPVATASGHNDGIDPPSGGAIAGLAALAVALGTLVLGRRRRGVVA